MHPRVEAFLKRKREEEKAVELAKRNKLFKKLGLYTEKEVSYSEGYDRVAWVDGKPVYYKWEIAEVSDEEYNEILKYAKAESKEQPETPTKKQFNPSEIEDNGEKKLVKVVEIVLWLNIAVCSLATLFCFIYAGIDGLIALLSSAFVILGTFILLWIVRVFTNISNKATAIYQLLKSQK